jgi:hypothetical protein
LPIAFAGEGASRAPNKQNHKNGRKVGLMFILGLMGRKIIKPRYGNKSVPRLYDILKKQGF